MNKKLVITLSLATVFFISACSSYHSYIPSTSPSKKRKDGNKDRNVSNASVPLDKRYFTGINVYHDKFIQELEKEVNIFPDTDNSTDEVSNIANSTRVSSANKTQSDNIIADLEFELTLRETEAMQKYFHYYTQKKHKTFQRWLNRSEPYLPYVKKIFESKGLPVDLIFLPFAESGFNPWAYSNAGAAGMWQFIPGTAKNCGLDVNWWIDERRDPYKSTIAAANHLKRLYSKFQDWYLVLAAYNTGEYHIEKALDKSNKSTYFQLCNSRSLLYDETRMYVPKFMAILKIIKNLEQLEFDPINWQGPETPNKLQIDGGTDLFAFAKSLGWDWSTFRNRNPFYNRRMSPPNKKMQVYLPEKLNKQAKSFLKKPSSSPYADYNRYKIRRGDSWWKLSRKFQVPVKILKNINNKNTDILHPGQSILIPASAAQVANADQRDSKHKYNRKYRVQKGDSLWSIAKKFDKDVENLREANNISRDSDPLQINQELVIPIDASRNKKRQLAEKRANYKVKKGDSLWKLSKRFGVSIRSLKQANGLSHSVLREGKGLYIPDMSNKQTRSTQQKAKSAHSNIIKYVVKKGDNLWHIARKFGVNHSKLLTWNNISKEELIHPGDKLDIYLR